MPFKLKGYDPTTGKELWSAKVGGTYCYSSPLFIPPVQFVGEEKDVKATDGIAVYGGSLVKLGGAGDITKDQLKHKVGAMFISTAVVEGDYLYTYSNVGIPSCYEWKTGKELWKSQIAERPGGAEAWGSPIYAAGRIYITDRQGTTTVVAAGPKYELLAVNRLGEHVDASIAVSGGDLFIRTHKHLWCIGEK